MTYVYLGRFCPFHDGHKLLLTRLVEKFGIENCLVIVGSANVINERTPYSFEERKNMIQKYFPQVRITPLDDVGNNQKWLKSLKILEDDLKTKFIFYGGSIKDLEILATEFETEILVDRQTEGLGISGTKIRDRTP